MPSIREFKETPRKELHVFYVLDTSGSMEGAFISALNHAMEECTEALTTLAKSNGDAKLKIAVLEFNSGCKWVTTNGPEDLEDFEWEYLKAGGLTDMGAALKELDSKLSRHAFLDSMTGALMPVIIFMTDGYATDDYDGALGQIRGNKWFKKGIKIGFAIGDDPDIAMISSVVGNREAVIKTTDLNVFQKLMKFVTVRSSMLQSQSHTTTTAATGSDIVEMAIKEKVVDDNVKVNEQVKYNPEPVDEPEDDWDDGEW